MPLVRFSSLRQRILVVVLLGAILPLALAGTWLARRAVGSAEGLLRTQIDTSLATIAARVEERWQYRRGDLLFLSGNDVALRSLRSDHITAADSAFMLRLFSDVALNIPHAQIRARNGAAVWTFNAVAQNTAVAGGVRSLALPQLSPTSRIAVSIPIHGETGELLGTLDADVRIDAVLPADSAPILLQGAQLTVTDRRSGRAMAFAGSGDAPHDVTEYAIAGEPWIASHRGVADSMLVLTVSAPTRAYVMPFERAARVGLLVLVAVTVGAVVLTYYFTARTTRSLERLVNAADAVAAGDLERNVAANGSDEVGRLAKSFNTMVESLRRTLRELSHREALAAVGEFASSLSHEVRNGLSAVRVDLQRVEESTPDVNGARELVTRALRNVQRLNSTVTGSLAVARSGRAELHPVDLRAVLRAAAAASDSAFASSGSTLEVDVDSAGECEVRGDTAALEQLFVNLLLNAGQALSPGGRARMELRADDVGVTVVIRDSGAGIAADQIARTGEPFYSTKRGGTGLGLSIARKIADAHGGQLAIESVPGQGTVVRVRFTASQSRGPSSPVVSP